MAGSAHLEQDSAVSVPRGSPVFVIDAVSAITNVQHFQAAVLDELKGLEHELSLVWTTDFEDEIEVDDLKIFTEEELVQKAFKEAFKDEKLLESTSQNVEEDNDKLLANTISQSSGGDNCSINASNPSSRSRGKKRSCAERKKRKKGRAFDRETRSSELEGAFVEKVKVLANIMDKQNEDKAAAKLHSFNGMAAVDELAIALPDKIEKLRPLRCIEPVMKAKFSPAADYVPICYPETVITVEVFHGRRTNLKMQEVLVLGSQMLTQLRDGINCKMDRLMQKEKLSDPSAYFLIEDAFYNDLRNSSATDYSEPILHWLKESKEEAQEKWEYIAISAELQKKQRSLLGSESISRLPAFRTSDMHKTRFDNLDFRLGCGYLYCHQGDCKHTIVIRDMRLIHPEDCQNRLAYPIITFLHRERRPKCSICNIYLATKVTLDDRFARENPSYFCDKCYFLLHYAEDGYLLDDGFMVYDCYHEGMD